MGSGAPVLNGRSGACRRQPRGSAVGTCRLCSCCWIVWAVRRRGGGHRTPGLGTGTADGPPVEDESSAMPDLTLGADHDRDHDHGRSRQRDDR